MTTVKNSPRGNPVVSVGEERMINAVGGYGGGAALAPPHLNWSHEGHAAGV